MRALVNYDQAPDMAYSIWQVISQPAAIFEADDRGAAIIIEDDLSPRDALELKFPAPPGFSFIYGQNDDTYYYKYDSPLAKKTTTWGEIFEALETCPTVLVAAAGRQLPENCYQNYNRYYDRDYNNLYGFTNEIVGKCGGTTRYPSGFIRVYKDISLARRLQSCRKRREKRNDTNNAYAVDRLTLRNLKELQTVFAVELVGPIDGFYQTAGLSPKRNNSSSKSRNRSRLSLIRKITELRQLCIRLKRDWRSATTTYDRYDFYHYLRPFLPFIPALLANKDADYQKFGRWLRYEQRLHDKQLAENKAKAEAAAKTKTAASKAKKATSGSKGKRKVTTR